MFLGFSVFCCCCCSCPVAQLYPTLCNPMDCSTPGFPVLHHLLEFAQTHIHWVHDDIQPISSSVAPFSSCPESFLESRSFPMNQLFSSGGQSIGASASIPSSEFSGLTSFRIDWFELFAVQGTLKCLSQEYCLCASWEGSLPVLL